MENAEEMEDWMHGFARWMANRCARFDREEEDFDELSADIALDGFDPGDRQYFMECRVANLCEDWILGGELDAALEEAYRIFAEAHVPAIRAEAMARASEMAAAGLWDMFRQ